MPPSASDAAAVSRATPPGVTSQGAQDADTVGGWFGVTLMVTSMLALLVVVSVWPSFAVTCTE